MTNQLAVPFYTKHVNAFQETVVQFFKTLQNTTEKSEPLYQNPTQHKKYSTTLKITFSHLKTDSMSQIPVCANIPFLRLV